MYILELIVLLLFSPDSKDTTYYMLVNVFTQCMLLTLYHVLCILSYWIYMYYILYGTECICTTILTLYVLDISYWLYAQYMLLINMYYLYVTDCI